MVLATRTRLVWKGHAALLVQSLGLASSTEMIISTRALNTTPSTSGGANVALTTFRRQFTVVVNRNLGIIVAFLFGFTFTYLLATEKIQAAKSKGEVLVFRRGYIPTHMKLTNDEENASGEKTVHITPLDKVTSKMEAPAAIHRQTKIFHWKDVCYDIKIKGNPRRLLDNVDGWVKPGTLTALMVLFILRTSLFTPADIGCTGRIRCRQDNAFGRTRESCNHWSRDWRYVRPRPST